MRGNRHAANRNLQPQWPFHFDPVEIDQGAPLEYGEVAALVNLAHDPAQNGAPLRRGAIVAQHVEPEVRQAFTDDVCAPARLPGEKACLLEQRKRAVERGLGQLRCLHEFRKSHCPAGAHQYFEYTECLQGGGCLARDLSRFCHK